MVAEGPCHMVNGMKLIGLEIHAELLEILKHLPFKNIKTRALNLYFDVLTILAHWLDI